MRNLPDQSRRFNEGMMLLGAHAALLVVGVLIQVALAMWVAAGVFAASFGFVLVYAYVVATTIGYAAVAVRARQKPMAVRYRYLVVYHVAATLLMALILLLIVYNPVAVRPVGDAAPPDL
jgi:4-hydroxybenzoate polyprenyltransferase